MGILNEVYTVKGSNEFFRSKDDAKKYASLYNLQESSVAPLEVYESWEDYVKDKPYGVLERLCLNRRSLTSVNLPFIIHYKGLGKEENYNDDNCGIVELKKMIILANDKLKENHAYPQDVKDDEVIKIEIEKYEVELTARQFMELYKIFKERLPEVNKINKQIMNAYELGKAARKIDEKSFKFFLRKYIWPFELGLEQQEPLYLEMLEKDSFQDKSYLDLE